MIIFYIFYSLYTATCTVFKKFTNSYSKLRVTVSLQLQFTGTAVKYGERDHNNNNIRSEDRIIIVYI